MFESWADPADGSHVYKSRSGPMDRLPLPLRGWALSLDPSWKALQTYYLNGEDGDKDDSDSFGDTDLSILE